MVQIAVIGRFWLYMSYGVIRQLVALGDDGEIDTYDEAWAENDIACMCLSLLTVQALRFSIPGVLPN